MLLEPPFGVLFRVYALWLNTQWRGSGSEAPCLKKKHNQQNSQKLGNKKRPNDRFLPVWCSSLHFSLSFFFSFFLSWLAIFPSKMCSGVDRESTKKSIQYLSTNWFPRLVQPLLRNYYTFINIELQKWSITMPRFFFFNFILGQGPAWCATLFNNDHRFSNCIYECWMYSAEDF